MPTPTLSAEGKTAIDTLLHQAVASRNVPAVTCGVTSADGELYFAAAGERVFGEPDKGNVSEHTRLQLFSTTKLVTTIACLQLVDRGLIDLDSSELIESKLPELCKVPIIKGWDGKPVTVHRGKPLTLRLLLSHQSGAAYYFNNDFVARWVQENNIPSMFAGDLKAYETPLIFEPGTDWVYSIGIDWAGILVERLTGQSLEEYFKEHVFGPCGVADQMSFYPDDNFKEHNQQLCSRDDSGNLVHSAGLRPTDKVTGQLSGGGGLLGTAKGYLAFLRGILKSANGTGLISQAMYKELFTNSLPPRPHAAYASLGKMTQAQTYHDPAHTSNGTADGLGHSVGLVINETDSVHGRKAGSGCWDGAAKTQYWLDPASGIAGLCFTQIVAPNPDPIMPLFNKFERTLYDHLQ